MLPPLRLAMRPADAEFLNNGAFSMSMATSLGDDKGRLPKPKPLAAYSPTAPGAGSGSARRAWTMRAPDTAM